jgi:hypothetical protein
MKIRNHIGQFASLKQKQQADRFLRLTFLYMFVAIALLTIFNLG